MSGARTWAHRTPLVDGTPVPSTRTASRSARAVAFTDASMMWWVLRPADQREVQGQPGRRDDGPPELLHQLGIERRIAEDLLARRVDLVVQVRTTGEVEHRLDHRLVERHPYRREPPHARPCRPSASPRTDPRRMPVSSTVWWESISRSPLAATVRSMPLCRPSWSSMWSKNGRPVLQSVRPVPSTSSEMVMSVSRWSVNASRTGGALSVTPTESHRPSPTAEPVRLEAPVSTSAERREERVVLRGGAEGDPKATLEAAATTSSCARGSIGRPAPATPPPRRVRSVGTG